MPSYSIYIKGLDELQAAASKAGPEFVGLLQQAMVKSTVKLKNEISGNIPKKGITFQGNLQRSVAVVEASATRGIVGVGEKYGAYVEFGTKPHFPPVAPLERWASIKLGSPGAGFVIARKISKKGTRAQPYVEPAFRDNVDWIFDQFVQAGKIIVERLGD